MQRNLNHEFEDMIVKWHAQAEKLLYMNDDFVEFKELFPEWGFNKGRLSLRGSMDLILQINKDRP